MAETKGRQVRQRRVFYIPGYDPFHPRRYRELYRKEGAVQADISGYALQVTAGGTGGTHGWQVSAEIDGAPVAVQVEVLVWSDIVRASMAQGTVATYWQMARTCWVYTASGAIFRLARLRKGPTIAALYPIAVLTVQLACTALVFWAVWRVVGLAAAGSSVSFLWTGLALGLSGGAALMTLRWFRRIDNRIYAHYLMHDYAFTAKANGAYPPELEARIATFADRIAATLATDCDEVLVVGHSSGAHLAISILSDLIRAGRVPGPGCAGSGPALGLLTLGHVVPMVSFLPRAERLRADLRYLSARRELSWVDVTAPGDGCAFALCDPVAVTGVAPEDKCWPLVLSAAFTQTLSPERWRALRWRFFRLHFQYLCAFDRPGDFDYFRITAGPETLGHRFAGRRPSRSRIERPLSGYRNVA